MWQNWMKIIKKARSIQYAAIATGELAPKTTKHVAMFEDVTRRPGRLDIFVTGISHFFSGGGGW